MQCLDCLRNMLHHLCKYSTERAIMIDPLTQEYRNEIIWYLFARYPRTLVTNATSAYLARTISYSVMFSLALALLSSIRAFGSIGVFVFYVNCRQPEEIY
ncbi:hypothetical protein BD408DRAFT_102388 [Parasitella parasitica]|nr:hypothetical protein BD408DRAFT_102388 [Parasitella parasitica]